VGALPGLLVGGFPDIGLYLLRLSLFVVIAI